MKRGEFMICFFLILALTLFLWVSAHAQSATDTAATGDSASASVTPPPPAASPSPTTDPPARGNPFARALEGIFQRIADELKADAAGDRTAPGDRGAQGAN